MAWPSTETIVFAGLVALPAFSQVLGVLYVALKGKPSQQKIDEANRSPFIGYGITLYSVIGLIAVLAYFWFADPASQTLRDWLNARNQPPMP